jgi:nucleolar complex protein 2
MGPKKKSQKKFERKHLSGEIVRRKHAKVAAQRRRAKEMRLAASMKDDEEGEESDEEGAEGEGAAPAAGKKRLEDMSIDEFLNVGVVDGGDDSGDEDGDEDGEEGESDSDDDIPAVDEDEEEWPEGEGESDEDEEDSEDDDDDEDDDSEDDATENGDADALAGVKKSNRLLRSEIEEHQKELESLKDTDPEFYKFLQTEDSGLLDFDESEGEESEEDEDEDEDGDKKKDKGSFSDAKTLTTATVAKLCERAAGGEALGAARNLFRAYRAAAHYGDEDADEEAGVKLASSAAFHTLVTFTLEEADTILRGLLGQPQAGHPDEARLFKPHQQSRWKKVEPLAKSFLGNTLHLLGQLTDADMSRFLLARLNACVPFMHTFERLTKKILKAVLSLFGSGEPALRVQSILLIRNMAAVLPPPTLEKAAKGVYRQFAANAKFINATSVEHVLFMNTCVSEIYGLDQQQSYPLAFTYIRQLASLLRGALTNKSKEAFRAVYCWQYINCLECWVRVLQSHANDESAPLRPLVYPVAQVALGAARLLPSARYAPLRLRLIRVLNALSASTGHFVPVAPLLLELLGFSELNKAPVSSKTRPPDFSLVLRVAKQELRSPAVQEVIVEGALQLLAEHLNQWAYSPGFPELAHIPCRDLRRFCKATQVTRFRKCARSVVDAAERNSDWIGRKRDNVDFAPKDAERVRSFLSTEREGKKAPMEKLAAQLLDKERQRVAAHAATDVKITSGGRGSDGTSDDDEEDDDEYDEDQMANGGGDDDSDDEDDDDEDDEDDEDEDDEFEGMDDEDVLAALASRAGAAGGTGGGLQVRPKLPPKRNAADDGDVDVVEELVFSDDEEDEKPKKKKKKRF